MATNRPQELVIEATNNVRASLRGADERLSYASLASAGMLLAMVSMILIANSVLRVPGTIEYAVINLVQGVALPYVAELIQFIGSLTSATMLFAAWAMLLIIASVAQRWGIVVATALTPFATAAAIGIDRLLARQALPDSSLVMRSFDSASASAFPSGQIIAALLVYGLLFFLTWSIPNRTVRLTVQTASTAVVLIAGVAQVWFGSLWPTDVLLAYVLGGLILLPLLAIAQRVDVACGGIPLVSAAEVPHDESKPHTRALTSTIIFNGPTVSKIYRPGFIPRAIYWAAFQAEFPYMRNERALWAAVHRRNLIGQLTEFWYGKNLVARAIGVDRIAGRYAITSEYIAGSEPSDRDDARAFLQGLVERFEEAGLPTWQIDPRQPRATDNVLETEDGSYCVVDLESGLVSPLASLRAWRRALKRGLVPMYDDVFFDVTRAYIERHESAMRAEKSDAWVERLYESLATTEAETQAWHDSEPRIWSRILGRRRRHQQRVPARLEWAIGWFEDAIVRWRREGLITHGDAAQLRETVRSPQFLSVMPHFAVHLSSTILLRFPLGSIARVAYTTFHLLRATWHYVKRRISRESWRDEAGIHSPLVILIAAVPGFGAFAYLASKPIRSHQLLLRVGLDATLLKLPWRIYKRSGLRWLVTETPGLAHGPASRSDAEPDIAPMFAWSGEHRVRATPDEHPKTVAFVDGLAARSIV
jgi:hypothetical protein